MGRLDNNICVVTGGSRGIGRAACAMMALEGATVVVTDVLDDEGRPFAESLGGDCAYWHLDVGDEANVETVFQIVIEKYGRIDVLVNNAGVAGVNKPTHEVTSKEWEDVQRVNVKGVFYCTKHAVPSMKTNGGGSIINLSSIYGLIGAADVPPYHASKGAVRLMTKTDAMIYAPDKIRVNSIHPGFIMTPMLEGAIKMKGEREEVMKAFESTTPLGHIGEPDDIAYGIVYLASDESKFVTGSELVIDGGYTAR